MRGNGRGSASRPMIIPHDGAFVPVNSVEEVLAEMKKSDDNHENTVEFIEEYNMDRTGFLKVVGVFSVPTGGADDFSACVQADGPTPGAGMGYILVDSRKCQNCLSCMVACSLVNEGSANLSLSRIQVLGNPLGRCPDDVSISQCRQCEDPKCNLCLRAPHHFSPAGGGVGGMRACEAICPHGAIQFTTQMPVREALAPCRAPGISSHSVSSAPVVSP